MVGLPGEAVSDLMTGMLNMAWHLWGS